MSRPKTTTLQRAWGLYARGLIQAEMKRQRVTYPELVQRLELLGIYDDSRLLNNRIAEGKFSALLLCQIMCALDVQRLEFRWEEAKELIEKGDKDQKD